MTAKSVEEDKHRRTSSSNWHPLTGGHNRHPTSPVRNDQFYERDVKQHYVIGEFYDWVIDPRGFERLFHWSRSRAVRKIIGGIKGQQVRVSLDVGCGTGLITRHLPGRMVIGVDINRWNLARARLNATHAHFLLCDVDHLPFRSGTVDLAVCTEVLEHLYNPGIAVSEVGRVLEREGRLIGSVPSRSPVWSFRTFLSFTHPKSEPFHHNYTRGELRRLIGPHFTRSSVYLGNFMMNVFVEARSPTHPTHE